MMPAGDELTLPLPAVATLRVNVEALSAKVAVTDRAALITTAQVPLPLQAPVHPENVDPAAGAAVSVTDVPSR